MSSSDSDDDGNLFDQLDSSEDDHAKDNKPQRKQSPRFYSASSITELAVEAKSSGIADEDAATKDSIEKDETPLKQMLHFSKVGDFRRVLDLLKKGQSPVEFDETDRCGLHVAAANGHAEMIRLFLIHGDNIEPDLPNSEGSTALREAVVNDKERAASILIKFGANPDFKAVDGKSPRDFCGDESEMLRILNRKPTAHTSTFIQGESVLCMYENMLYQAKILEVIEPEEGGEDEEIHYFVHFMGWPSKDDHVVADYHLLKLTKENMEKVIEMELALKPSGETQQKPAKRKLLSDASDDDEEAKEEPEDNSTVISMRNIEIKIPALLRQLLLDDERKITMDHQVK